MMSGFGFGFGLGAPALNKGGGGVPADAIRGFNTQGVSQPIYGYSTTGQPTVIQGKAA